nr:hypothetical protein [Tanacetum cinerariifolium]
PPSLDYISGPEEPEQAPPLPDYVPGPEHAEDQPYAEDASSTAQSPKYVLESDLEAYPEEDDDEDPEEDPVDYPTDGGDDGDDEEGGSYALSWKPCQGDSLNLPDHMYSIYAIKCLILAKSNSYLKGQNKMIHNQGDVSK